MIRLKALIQLILFFGSSFTGLFLLCSQDEEMPQEPEAPLVPKIDNLKLMRREKLQAVMGSVLLERYLQPFDDWISSRGFVKDQIYNSPEEFNKEMWYVLVIKDRVEEPIWIKFHLTKNYEKHEHLGFTAEDVIVERHAKIVRRGLKAALEQSFILMLDNEEVRKSMIYGIPHLYRLITKDTKIENLRKEDLIN